jgi:mannosyl-oligosaccharide glucosidase
LSTSFVKIPGGAHGGSWGVRVKGVPREDAPEKLMTTVIFYATLEGIGLLEVENAEGHEKGFEDDVVLKGRSQGLGDYKMVITKGKGEHPGRMHKAYDNKPLDRTIVHSAKLPEGVLWQIKPLLFKQMKDEIDGLIEEYTQEDMPPPWQVYTIRNAAGQGNLHFVQKVFEGPFEFDVLFSSESSGEEITSEILEKEIESTSKSFGERFKSVFSLAKEFDTEEYEAFAKNMFSNLFGGIGYFQGNSVVDRSYAPEYDEENEGFWEETAEARGRNQQQLEGPSELFTSIPSRPFFPRGFFWDEGFHLLPISDWDMDVSLEIVKSWFNLMDEDGWIGREQILGDEARSKVPAEFQVQYPHYANPPTLYLILDAFIERLSNANNTKPAQAEALENSPDDLQSAHLKNPEAAEQYLRSIYPLLKKQWSWFRRTQAGDLTTYDRYAFSSKEGYRWRGRTVQHILTSGLDDYPRPQPPHPGELHVDLLSWMGVMTKSLHNIATYLEETEDAERFASVEKAIIHNLDDLHWSDKDQCYCDATVDEFEENKLVCHKGYISLFPFLTGLLSPDSPRLEPIMDLIADPEELWSEYGIRSLSKKDEFYGTDENYWRGPIWMPMNYLIVKELLVCFPPRFTLLSLSIPAIRSLCPCSFISSVLSINFRDAEYRSNPNFSLRRPRFRSVHSPPPEPRR